MRPSGGYRAGMFRRLATLVLLGSIVASASADTIRVAAAISLQEAMTQIAKDAEKLTGDTIELSFGSSGQLQTQIENGAPIDVFVSAGAEQMDKLVAGGRIDASTRKDIASNQLVLITPTDNSTVTSFDTLKNADRIALGEPKTVPAGKYAAQVLASLKLTDALKDKLIYGTNVRQVLAYVEQGQVSAGLVYATDAKQSGGKVRIVAVAPESSHDAIVYPAGRVANSAHREVADRFLQALASDAAQKVLADRGFVRPSTRPAQP